MPDIKLRHSTIIAKKAGHQIPGDLLVKVLKASPSSAGYCAQHTVDKKDMLVFEHLRNGGADINGLKKLQEGTKDLNLILWFNNDPDKFSPDTVQPYMYRIGEQDVMATFIEGGFAKFNKSEFKNELSEDLNVYNELVLPALARNMKIAGGDLQKFYAELNDDSFQKSLKMAISHRGVFCFLPIKGDPVVFGENELGGAFDWGATSQLHGFGAKVEVPPTIVEKAKEVVKGFGFFSKTESAPEPAPAAVPDPKTGVYTVSPDAPKVIVPEPVEAPEPEPTPISNGEFEEHPIPKNWSKNQKKDFIRKKLSLSKADRLPDGYDKAGFVLRVPVKKGLAVLQQIKDDATKPQLAVDNTKKADTPTDISKMIVTGKALESGTEVAMKYLDYNSGTITDPKEIQKDVAKYPTFTEKVGIKPLDLYFWPPNAFFELEKSALALVAIQLQQMAMVNVKVEELAATKSAEKVKLETDKHVAAVETLKEPEKKVASGGFGFGFGSKK